jgi:hypothetical protein
MFMLQMLVITNICKPTFVTFGLIAPVPHLQESFRVDGVQAALVGIVGADGDEDRDLEPIQ